MFDKIASLQVCRMPVLHLFLASLAFHGILASDATYERFGCKITGYQKKPDLDYFKYPMYSEKSMDSFKIDTSDTPYPRLPSGKMIMNGVSSFRRFIQELAEQSINPADAINMATSLLLFFKHFVVPFQQNASCNDPACFIISEFLNNKMKRKTRLNDLSDDLLPFYIANAYVDPEFPDGYQSASSVADDLIIWNMNVTIPQDHLAGVYKIFHSSSKRAGYVIMDPGYAYGAYVIHPFVATVMEDGNPPPKGFPSGVRNKGIKFSMFGKGNPKQLILAKHKNANTVSRVYYYVDKPYCSFMEAMIKADLLRTYHGIIRFDESGNTNGYLTFHASSNSSEESNRGLTFRTSKGNVKDMTKSEVEVSCTKDEKNKPNEKIEMIVKEAFGTYPEDIELARSITDDLKFIYEQLCDSQVWRKLNALKEPIVNIRVPYPHSI